MSGEEWVDMSHLLGGHVVGSEQKSVRLDTEENRKYVKDLLRKKEMEITFIKVNGEQRKMLCTRDGNRIPTNKRPKEDPTEKDPFGDDKIKRESKVLIVFDTAQQGWRSMRWESIRDIKERF